MARTKFPVEVLSPEGEIFNDEVEMVSTRTATGSIGVLANHTPLLAMLDPAELRLYLSENEVVRFAQGEGYMQVTGGRALLLVEEAHPPEALDRADLQDDVTRARRVRLGRNHAGARQQPGAARQRVAAVQHAGHSGRVADHVGGRSLAAEDLLA